MFRLGLSHDGKNILDEEKEVSEVKDEISIYSNHLHEYNTVVLALNADILNRLSNSITALTCYGKNNE